MGWSRGLRDCRHEDFAMHATLELEDAVRNAYSTAAQHPRSKHPFPVGRRFAKSIGYSAALLDSLPPSAYEAFTGVSCVSVRADLPEAADVLDLGCGAGLDALIAARRVGVRGRVVGVDFSEAMLARARQAAGEANTPNVDFRQSDAQRLPFADASFDVALVNGIFNLNPAREAIFSELARVVRRGGSVWAAELILKKPLPEAVSGNEANWFA